MVGVVRLKRHALDPPTEPQVRHWMSPPPKAPPPGAPGIPPGATLRQHDRRRSPFIELVELWHQSRAVAILAAFTRKDEQKGAYSFVSIVSLLSGFTLAPRFLQLLHRPQRLANEEDIKRSKLLDYQWSDRLRFTVLLISIRIIRLGSSVILEVK